MISTDRKANSSSSSPSLPISLSDTSLISKRLDMSKLMFSSDLLYESSLQIKNPIALKYSSKPNQTLLTHNEHKRTQVQPKSRQLLFPSTRRVKGLSFAPSSSSTLIKNLQPNISTTVSSTVIPGAFQTPTKSARSVSVDGFAVPFSRPSMALMATPITTPITKTITTTALPNPSSLSTSLPPVSFLSSLSTVASSLSASSASSSISKPLMMDTPTKTKVSLSTTRGPIFTPLKSIEPVSKFLGPNSSPADPNFSKLFTPPRSIHRATFKPLYHKNSAFRSKFSTPLALRGGNFPREMTLLRTPNSVSPANGLHSGLTENDNKFRPNSMIPPSLSSTVACPISSSSSPTLISPSASAGFAFISHSPETYRHQRPPTIDNAQLARRKRRRTSPTELSTLETEFIRCQKPSRDLREDIARRVGMSEKAVQIWFQNKRQAIRRGALHCGNNVGEEIISANSKIVQDQSYADNNNYKDDNDVEYDDTIFKDYGTVSVNSESESSIPSNKVVFGRAFDHVSNTKSPTGHTSPRLSSSNFEGTIASVARAPPLTIFEDSDTNKIEQIFNEKDSVSPLTPAKRSLSEGSNTDVDEDDHTYEPISSTIFEDKADKENQSTLEIGSLRSPSSLDDSNRQASPSKLRLCMKDGQAQIMVAGVLNGCNRTFPLKSANMKSARTIRRSISLSQKQQQQHSNQILLEDAVNRSQAITGSESTWSPSRNFYPHSPFDSTPNTTSSTPKITDGYYLSARPKTYSSSVLGARNMDNSSPTKKASRIGTVKTRRFHYGSSASSPSPEPLSKNTDTSTNSLINGSLETSITMAADSIITNTKSFPITSQSKPTATASLVPPMFDDIEKTKIFANISRARSLFNKNRAYLMNDTLRNKSDEGNVRGDDICSGEESGSNRLNDHGGRVNSVDNSEAKSTSLIHASKSNFVEERDKSSSVVKSSGLPSKRVSADSTSPSPSSRTDKEYECISNLLSLKSGAWC